MYSGQKSWYTSSKHVDNTYFGLDTLLGTVLCDKWLISDSNKDIIHAKNLILITQDSLNIQEKRMIHSLAKRTKWAK